MLYGKKLLHTWIKETKSKIMYFFADEEILQSIKSFYKEKKLSDFFFLKFAEDLPSGSSDSVSTPPRATRSTNRAISTPTGKNTNSQGGVW